MKRTYIMIGLAGYIMGIVSAMSGILTQQGLFDAYLLALVALGFFIPPLKDWK